MPQSFLDLFYPFVQSAYGINCFAPSLGFVAAWSPLFYFLAMEFLFHKPTLKSPLRGGLGGVKNVYPHVFFKKSIGATKLHPHNRESIVLE